MCKSLFPATTDIARWYSSNVGVACLASAKRGGGGGGGGRKLPLSTPATQAKVSAKDSNQAKTFFYDYFFQWIGYGIRRAAKGGPEGKDKRKSAKSEKTKGSVPFTTAIGMWTESLMVPFSFLLTLGARGFSCAVSSTQGTSYFEESIGKIRALFIWGSVRTYSWNTRPHGVYANPWPVHTKTLKRWKYDSIRHRACVILVVNDVWHHCFENLRFRPSTRKRETGVFKFEISTLESVFEKIRFRWSFSPDTRGR